MAGMARVSRPTDLAASASDLPATRWSSILSCMSWTSFAARRVAISFFTSSLTSSNGFTLPAMIFVTRTIRKPNLPFTTSLGWPSLSVKAASAIAGSTSPISDLASSPRSRSAAESLRALAMSSKLAPALICASAGVRIGLVGKHDLLDGAFFGDDIALVFGRLVFGLGVLVGHLVGLGERRRADEQDVGGAILRGAIARLALVEEGLERLGGRRRDVARGARRQR